MANNTPTGFLSEDDKTKLLKEINDNETKHARVAGVCGLCKDALERKVLDMQEFLVDVLSPDVLFSDACFQDSRVFTVVRHILDAIGVNTTHSVRNARVPIKLANALYVDDGLKSEALQMINDFYARQYPGRTPHNVSNGRSDRNFSKSSDLYNITRNRSSVTSNFSDGAKYSGAISCKVPLHRVRKKFENLVAEQEIPKEQQLSLMHCCLSGMALDFFYSELQDNPQVQNIESAFHKLEKQFNSFQHQAQARVYLNNQSLTTTVSENSCSPLVGLEIIHQRILDTAPKCGPDYQADNHRQDYLANAVKSCSWATNVLQARLTPSSEAERYDYNTLYSKLTAALTATTASDQTRINSSNVIDSTSPVFFGSKYANPKTKRRSYHNDRKIDVSSMLRPMNRTKKGMNATELQQLKARTRCMRCKEIGHWRQECPQRNKQPLRQVLLAQIDEMGRDEAAIANTLLALAEEEEEYEAYVNQAAANGNGDSEGNENLFELLVNECDDMENIYTQEAAHEDLDNLFTGFSSTIHTSRCLNDNRIIYRIPKNAGKNSNNINSRRQNYQVPIPLTNLEFYGKSNEKMFLGALLDTGAQRSVMGLQQAKIYCREAGIGFNLIRSTHHFRFGAGDARSIGQLMIIMVTPGSSIQLKIDVVKPNIPLLIGLDVMDRHRFQVLTVENCLQSVAEGWKAPTVRKHGHIYFEWSSHFRSFLSKVQLERLHRHLMHPSATKLYDLLSRAGPENLSTDTRKILREIAETCETCKVYSKKQFNFRIREGGETRFNQRVLLDIMYLETGAGRKVPVLHIVDSGTHFQNASFLRNSNSTTVWNTFLKIWATIYIGFPESLLTDQGSVFLSRDWKFNCELAEIELLHTGTESHNSLGAGETFHDYLRRVFNKSMADHSNVAPDVVLAISVKAINSTVGPHGLCPQLLVFGVLPRLPEISKDFPDHRERMRVLHTARKEYERISAEKLIKRGLKKIPPPAADHVYQPGDFVFVYREGLKHYTGPHPISEVNGKHVRLHLGERTGPRSFNISQLRPSTSRDPSTSEERGGLTTNALQCYADTEITSVLWTEDITPGDPREVLFDDAKRQEILGLIDRGTFRVVLEEEAGPNPNIIPSRYVLAIKHGEDGSVRYKARFVVGGHRDKGRHSVVHNSATLKQSSMRVLIALATILGFDIWTMDVRQAYLQSAVALQRDVFIKPDQVELQSGELLKLVRPLYGLSDSGDYWCETFAKFHTNNLRMHQSTGDFALFFRRIANQLVALSGAYVDDVILASRKDQKKEINRQLRNKFDVTMTDATEFVYTGIMCDVSRPELRTLSQSQYIKRLRYLPNSAEFSSFRSTRARLMWVVHTRPDVACAVSFMGQTTTESFTDSSVKLANRVIRHLKNTPEITLKFQKLDQDSLSMVVYSDASFNNCINHRSQLGYIICLADESRRCSILHYSSFKSTRVTRSSMAGETLAFAAGFDNSFLLLHELQRMLGRKIPLLIFTYSRQLFDVLTRSKYTTERRLMVDIAAARQAYHESTISNIGLIRLEHNIADSSTKDRGNGALLSILHTS